MPSSREPSATASGVPPVREILSESSVTSAGMRPPCSLTNVTIASVAPFAQLAAFDVDAAHLRVGGERDELRVVRGDVAAAQAVLLLGEHDDRAAFRRFVGQARELRGIGHLAFGDAGRRQELHGLAAAERDRAGLVEQQRVDVAGRFDGLAAHRQHVVLHHAVHAGDADRRQQAADRRRNQADEQRDVDGNRRRRAGAGRVDAVDGVRHERRDGEQEDDRQAGDHDVQRDLVRRLLPLGAFDERDHPIEERLAGIRRDLDLDLIRQHARAAGHGAAVAARLADDRRAFAGDDRLVDGRDAFDDLAVSGNRLRPRCRPRRRRPAASTTTPSRSVRSSVTRFAMVSVLVLRSDSACALPRASAIASAKVANRTVNQSQRSICSSKPMLAGAGRDVADEEQQHQRGADLDDEDDRILHQRHRIQLQHRILQRAAQNLRDRTAAAPGRASSGSGSSRRPATGATGAGAERMQRWQWP